MAPTPARRKIASPTRNFVRRAGDVANLSESSVGKGDSPMDDGNDANGDNVDNDFDNDNDRGGVRTA
jgi:hypothetical protein